MTVLITLTIAQSDTGPFDLYSNSDGFVTPFATNVPKASLQAGYLSAVVPNTTAIIRCTSKGICTNSIDMTLVTTTTTSTSTTVTSTTTEIPCGASSSSGVAGITTRNISLSPLGGIIVFEMNAEGVPDKLEFIHNGVKKATTSMSGPNSGPFDNVYGTEPSNVVPTVPQTTATVQFIGTDKGSVPTRNADFLTDTGITGVVVEAGYQQLVWWKYTPADFAIAPNIQIRVTGPTGTAWNVKRLCPDAVAPCSLFTTGGDDIRAYVYASNTTTFLETGISPTTNDIANTVDRMWTYSTATIYEYAITYNPWTFALNRTINVPGLPSFLGAGLTAISNTKLIGSSLSVIKEFDITTTTAVTTNKITIPAGAEIGGDMMYTTTGKLIFSTVEVGGTDHKLYQYDYASATQELVIDLGAIDIFGMFVAAGKILIIDPAGQIYNVGLTAPHAVTLDKDTTFSTYGASQAPSCVNISFTP